MARRVFAIVVISVTFSLSGVAQRGGFDQSPMPQRQQADRSQSPFGSFGREVGSITGRVSSPAGRPLKNVQVQLHDLAGSLAGSTYTDVAGGFSFDGVPAGDYDIVAVSGINQASDRVSVSGMPVTTALQMPESDKPQDDGGANTISVAHFQVPEKARKEFMKAHEAVSRLKIDEANKHLRRALEIYPNYADALTLRAILELDKSEIDAALHDTQKAIQADDNYALAYTVLASALNATGRFDEALQTLQHNERLAPNAWQIYYEEAKAYLGKADYGSTMRQLDRARSLASADFPQMHLLRARAMIGLNQYAGAGAELESFLQKVPEGPESDQARSMLAKVKEKGK